MKILPGYKKAFHSEHFWLKSFIQNPSKAHCALYKKWFFINRCGASQKKSHACGEWRPPQACMRFYLEYTSLVDGKWLLNVRILLKLTFPGKNFHFPKLALSYGKSNESQVMGKTSINRCLSHNLTLILLLFR